MPGTGAVDTRECFLPRGQWAPGESRWHRPLPAAVPRDSRPCPSRRVQQGSPEKTQPSPAPEMHPKKCPVSFSSGRAALRKWGQKGRGQRTARGSGGYWALSLLATACSAVPSRSLVCHLSASPLGRLEATARWFCLHSAEWKAETSPGLHWGSPQWSWAEGEATRGAEDSNKGMRDWGPRQASWRRRRQRKPLA